MNGAFGHAPAHWRSMRLKHTVKACTNGIWGEESRGGPEDVLCVRVADFDRLRLRAEVDHPTLRFVPSTHRRGRMLERGDLLLEKSGGGEGQPVGVVVMYDSDRPAVSSNFVARMPVERGFDARYLCYLHAALYRLGVNCRSIRQTTGIQNLDSKAYLDEVVRVPDFAEQQRIAEFLDRKTGMLDSLVRNKQRLLGLLRERRDTLVSHVVTSGLDARVEPKLSGATPGHWRATRFKFIRSGALLYGANEPAIGGDRDDPRYIRITDLADDGTLREDTFQSLSERLAAPYLLRDGDILLARSGATVGKAFRYREECGRACFGSYLIRLRPDRRKILPDYLYYYTRSWAYRSEVRLHTVQSTIANVSAERYGNFAIPVPPLTEQQAIVEFLQKVTGALDRLMAAIERQLGRLEEYRGSLIVAAVTGECQVEQPAAPNRR
jgi:type I restriction enzyme, S subunit